MKKFNRSSGFTAGLGFLLLAARPAAAHSWVDQLMNIATNGTMSGTPGYIRGYVSRALAGFSDSMDDYLLPPNGRSTGNEILPTDSLCHSSQTIGNYSAAFPMLSVSAGDYIALRYQENGHVTLPDVNPTKPLNRGTVYIYGTTQPASNELFLDVFQNWTADGTGGDGRGRLLATRNFDDDQCYQVNSGNISVSRQAEFKKVAENPQGADLWCQNDIQLPSDLAAGTNYTLYWVWNWPTFNKAGSPTDIPSDGYNVTLLQYYTSCMDVAVVGGSSSSDSTNSSSAGKDLVKTNNFASSFIKSQDLNSAAVLSQLEIGAFQVSVPGDTGSNSSTSSSAGSNASTGTAKATTSATANANGDHTVVVTVTETQAPVYITVTVPAGGAAATASTSTSSSSTTKSGRKTRTLTSYSVTYVTETLRPSSNGGVAVTPSPSSSSGVTATPGSSSSSRNGGSSSGGATETPSPSSSSGKGGSSISSSSSGTPAAATPEFTPTPGQTLTIKPFLSASSSSIASGYRNGTSTTLLRVRRA